MSDLNRHDLIGNLGSDPETHNHGDRTVTRFRLATSRRWRDPQGEQKEDTQWHTVTCWGQLAVNVAKHLSKGRKVYVSGRIHHSEYEGQNGVKLRGVETVAQTVLFLDKGPDQ